MKKRTFMHTAAALALASALPVAHAQDTPIKFQLDWRFEGPAALFLQPVAKGHFKAAGLDVTVDAGNGSGGAVQRVASGTYDMGFADLAAVMEFHANNPDAQNKPVAVMMVYNNTPASVMALKKSGITKPADLAGKKLGAPRVRRRPPRVPIFQKANGIGAVTWTSHGPAPARNHAGARRRRRHHRLHLHLAAQPGSPWRQGRRRGGAALRRLGVKLYGNVIIASPKLIKENPAAIKAFLSAFTKGAKEVIANPAAAIEHVRRAMASSTCRWKPAACSWPSTPSSTAPTRAPKGLARPCRPPVADGFAGVDAFNTKNRASTPTTCGTPASCPARRNSTSCPRSKTINLIAAQRLIRALAAISFKNKNDLPCRLPIPISWTSAMSGSPTTTSCAPRTSLRWRPSTCRSQQGEFIAIVGPSGCGKSTFMKLATGLRCPPWARSPSTASR